MPALGSACLSLGRFRAVSLHRTEPAERQLGLGALRIPHFRRGRYYQQHRRRPDRCAPCACVASDPPSDALPPPAGSYRVTIRQQPRKIVISIVSVLPLPKFGEREHYLKLEKLYFNVFRKKYSFDVHIVVL